MLAGPEQGGAVVEAPVEPLGQLAGAEVPHEAVDWAGEPVGVERHRAMHVGQRAAELLEQTPAGAEAEDAGGQERDPVAELEDAEILLDQAGGDGERDRRWRSQRSPVIRLCRMEPSRSNQAG